MMFVLVRSSHMAHDIIITALGFARICIRSIVCFTLYSHL